MNESDRALFAIYQIKRAAIGDINAQTNISLVRDQGVTILKTNVPVQRRIDYSRFAPVNLSRSSECVAEQAQFAPRFAMNLIEVRDHNIFVV
jgi:hypothetical protein